MSRHGAAVRGQVDMPLVRPSRCMHGGAVVFGKVIGQVEQSGRGSTWRKHGGGGRVRVGNTHCHSVDGNVAARVINCGCGRAEVLSRGVSASRGRC